ncbi:hypothetical protein [Pseudonocardia spinosispora]|uniref:hypothetical protein n=1 Tax=Pseudonocardia spinosispora TaxID=103441 RepID=UPI00041F1FEA|nr:hypothetical protein [Pseudonocardia spinosispora]
MDSRTGLAEDTYVTEAYGVCSQEWISRGNLTPNGLDHTAANEAFAQFTEGLPGRFTTYDPAEGPMS